MEYKAQSEKLLAFFEARAGEWIPLPDILALGMASHTRRIHELRKHHNIEMRDQRFGEQRRVWYRLVKPQPVVVEQLTDPNMQAPHN
jgi:hypothetical protein